VCCFLCSCDKPCVGLRTRMFNVRSHNCIHKNTNGHVRARARFIDMLLLCWMQRDVGTVLVVLCLHITLYSTSFYASLLLLSTYQFCWNCPQHQHQSTTLQIRGQNGNSLGSNYSGQTIMHPYFFTLIHELDICFSTAMLLSYTYTQANIQQTEHSYRKNAARLRACVCLASFMRFLDRASSHSIRICLVFALSHVDRGLPNSRSKLLSQKVSA